MFPAETVTLDAFKIVLNVTSPLRHLVTRRDLAAKLGEPYGTNVDLNRALSDSIRSRAAVEIRRDRWYSNRKVMEVTHEVQNRTALPHGGGKHLRQ